MSRFAENFFRKFGKTEVFTVIKVEFYMIEKTQLPESVDDREGLRDLVENQLGLVDRKSVV